MIDLQQLHLHYPSRQGLVHALRGVDLKVAAGEIYGVIGRSGAGKSSLVRAINLLHRPTEGRVVVDGVELTALPPAQLRAVRRDLGMVFQHFNLLASRTVYDNIALPLELAGLSAAAIRSRVQPLLELVGLAGLADRYPAQISGGQKQRVGIARALANQPKVLLCDEATSALDPETTRSILALLQDINRNLGLTIVLITHQMQVIKQVAHRLAVMEAGQIVEEGRTLEVFAEPRHPVTRSLLDEVVPQGLPASVHARAQALLQTPGPQAGQLWQLAFHGDSAAQPLLSTLAQRFGLDLHLLHGQIDEVQGQLFGNLAVLSRGPQVQLQAAVQHLKASGIRVQELSHV